MSDFLNSSSYFGVTVCIIGYALGVFLKKKLKLGLLNPLLVSIIFAILVIRIFGVDYENFSQSAKCLSYLLTPATVCLAKREEEAAYGAAVSGMIAAGELTLKEAIGV